MQTEPVIHGPNPDATTDMPRNTILLVEDNDNDEILTRRALEKTRLVNEVIVARDGAEALEFLFGEGAEDRELPQLVLLDLKLPKVDGIEVLRRIRDDRRTHRLPVVVLTSSDEEQDRYRSYDLGVNSYVRKPVQSDHFKAAVEELGMYWLVLNRPPPQE